MLKPRACAFAFACLLAATPAAALAELPPDTEIIAGAAITRTTAVWIGDLDLGQADGRRLLRTRLREAAFHVCRDGPAALGATSADIRDCYVRALRQARHAVSRKQAVASLAAAQ